MSIYLFRLLFGYVEFSFTGGFCEGFVNDCFEQFSDVKNVIRTEDGLLAYAPIKTYKQLHKIALKNGGKVKVIRRRGLPFFIAPLKKRWGFFLGAFVFVLLLSFMSAFVWDVEVVGNERISEAELHMYLENNKVEVGALWSSFDRRSLSYAVMADFEDVAWAHINKIGTTARLEINETTAMPSEISEGDKEKSKINREQIELTVNRVQSRSEKVGENKYKTLLFYGFKIPLYLSKINGVNEKETDYLIFKDKELPIAIITDTEKYYEKHEMILSDEQLKTLANERLDEEKNNLFAGCEIVNQNVKTKIDEDVCIITGSFVVRYP